MPTSGREILFERVTHQARQLAARATEAEEEIAPDEDPFKTDHRLQRVKALVERRFPARVTLEEAAKCACMERHYFSAFFGRKIGQSFSHWRRMQRVSAAVELMKKHKSLEYIALRVGYRSLSGLERAFKSTLHKTPRESRSAASQSPSLSRQ